MLQNAKEFYDRFIQEQLDAPEVHHDLGLAHLRLAKIQQALGDFAAAEAFTWHPMGRRAVPRLARGRAVHLAWQDATRTGDVENC